MMWDKSEFALLLARTLAVFQWAVHEKYGADKADFGELYCLMALKLREPGGRKAIEKELIDLGLDVDVHI